jgi:ribosomal protein L7Ae-like RNA K-turn-binding protein
MNRNKVLGTLGLARRARKMVLGETAVWEALRNSQAKWVLLASDTGKNTTKRIVDKTHFYHVTLTQTFSTEELSRAIGLENTKVIALTDSAFAELLSHAIDE